MPGFFIDVANGPFQLFLRKIVLDQRVVLAINFHWTQDTRMPNISTLRGLWSLALMALTLLALAGAGYLFVGYISSNNELTVANGGN